MDTSVPHAVGPDGRPLCGVCLTPDGQHKDTCWLALKEEVAALRSVMKAILDHTNITGTSYNPRTYIDIIHDVRQEIVATLNASEEPNE